MTILCNWQLLFQCSYNIKVDVFKQCSALLRAEHVSLFLKLMISYHSCCLGVLFKGLNIKYLLQDLNPLSDLFLPGMLLRCAVVAVERTAAGYQSIQLTINPKEVNKALNTAALRPGMVGDMGL